MVSLEDQLEDLHQEESRILKKIDERNKKRKIKCGGCDDYHEIGDLTVIQTHWCTEPHGCNGGDYWNEGELRFVCPETGIVNRLLFDYVSYEERGSYEKDPLMQFKRMYKKLFNGVVDEHSKETLRFSSKWVNNYYVDKNRGKFGLVKKSS
jgi:hypothetical protein